MPQAPQAPSGMQIGGMNVGSFGVGYGAGGVRVGYGGGDLSPKKLFAAVISGEAFEKPRMAGLLMLGLAMLFTIVNAILIFALQIYFPYFLVLAGPLWWGGAWLAVTGQPATKPDGSQPPVWSRIGLGACLAFGILVGIGMVIAIR
jgi:hypothetical protein